MVHIPGGSASEVIGRTTIKDRQTKQLTLMAAHGVAVTKLAGGGHETRLVVDV